MSRHPDPTPTKAALYQRKWRARNPLPLTPKKAAKLQMKTLWGDKLGAQVNKADVYRETQKQRYRWDAVLKARKDLIFKNYQGLPQEYFYVDAIYRRDNKPAKKVTPQSEYQRRYREKRRAELPESVALSLLLEHLPEELHETLTTLLHAVRRAPPPPATKPEPITLEQKMQAVLEAGRDLDFNGETIYLEDALWRRNNPSCSRTDNAMPPPRGVFRRLPAYHCSASFGG